MVAIALPEATTLPKTPTARPRKVPERISWETFQRRYLTREDQFKYEWVNGFVEKTTRSMDTHQLYILTNLLDFFNRLSAGKPGSGYLISEGDTFFSGNHRRPDIAYYTAAQIEAGKNGAAITPNFVIEIISKNDQILKVRDKMKDYRRANVKVIWHVFPQGREIHVYHGKQMTVCTEPEDLCSAEAVIPGFVLPLSEVFK